LRTAGMLVKKLIKQECPDMECIEGHEINKTTFEYYFAKDKFAIDITGNNILKQRIQSFYKNNETPEAQVAFISEIEIFEKVRVGWDYFKDWLKEIIAEKKNYESPVSPIEYFFVSKKYIENGE